MLVYAVAYQGLLDSSYAVIVLKQLFKSFNSSIVPVVLFYLLFQRCNERFFIVQFTRRFLKIFSRLIKLFLYFEQLARYILVKWNGWMSELLLLRAYEKNKLTGAVLPGNQHMRYDISFAIVSLS